MYNLIDMANESNMKREIMLVCPEIFWRPNLANALGWTEINFLDSPNRRGHKMSYPKQQTPSLLLKNVNVCVALLM